MRSRAIPPDAVSVEIRTTPPGVQVRIDNELYGQSPLEAHLSPGDHVLHLEGPGLIPRDQTVHVRDTGASVGAELWKLTPDVLPVRPAYPGATLLDGRFLDDGRLALLYATDTSTPPSVGSRELWTLDPATGEMSRVGLPNTPRPARCGPCPGRAVRRVCGSSLGAVTASLWPASPSLRLMRNGHDPETVWVARADNSAPPIRSSPYR